MKLNINSLYICVGNMERAIRFYEEFFGMPVTERDEIYSVFDVGGFRFGLFAYERVNEVHSFGSNCVPSITAGSADELRKKLNGRRIVFPLTRIGLNWVAEIEDSEGNHIEITAPYENE